MEWIIAILVLIVIRMAYRAQEAEYFATEQCEKIREEFVAEIEELRSKIDDLELETRNAHLYI